jgi:enoyl-CoA hydratase/carnithine racemase
MTSTFAGIITHKIGRVLVVTLNRPKSLNAWTDEMYRTYGLILDKAASDQSIACVLLTGNGKHFSAGQDVNELSKYPVGETGAPSFNKMLRSHVTFPKPLVVAVRGVAIGWGATLLATADLVVMSTTARIRVPFTALGLAPEAGSSLTFPALMKQDANWLLYSSEYMNAIDCKRVGLAFKVVSDFYLMSEVNLLVQSIADKPIASLMATKKLIVQSKSDAILKAHDREQIAFASGLLGGPANQEALKALREKRPPDFSKM